MLKNFRANFLNAFNLLKNELSNAVLQSVDQCLPFVAECDALNVAISAPLNEWEHLQPLCQEPYKEVRFTILLLKKEATAIFEAVRKWYHLFSRNTFILITDQRSVSLMLDSKSRSKIKNDKIQQWP